MPPKKAAEAAPPPPPVEAPPPDPLVLFGPDVSLVKPRVLAAFRAFDPESTGACRVEECWSCGEVMTDDGKIRKVSIDFEPFRPINTSLYMCDNKFHTDALSELLQASARRAVARARARALH